MPKIYEYALLAKEVYDDFPKAVGEWKVGYTRLKWMHGELQAAIFTKNQQSVMAFKGTSDFKLDALADLKLGFCVNTSYFSKAETFVANQAPEGTILTGHSLGGAITQAVGHRMGLPFVTFNAPGVALMPTFSTGSVMRNLSQISPVGALRMAGAAYGAVRHRKQTMSDIRHVRRRSDGINYRLSGDPVSQWGIHRGKVVTLSGSDYPLSERHAIDNMLAEVMFTSTGNDVFH